MTPFEPLLFVSYAPSSSSSAFAADYKSQFPYLTRPLGLCRQFRNVWPKHPLVIHYHDKMLTYFVFQSEQKNFLVSYLISLQIVLDLHAVKTSFFVIVLAILFPFSVVVLPPAKAAIQGPTTARAVVG